MCGYEASRFPLYAPFDPPLPQIFLLLLFLFVTPFVREIDRDLVCSGRL
jgi:hypothetical protein